MAAAAEFSSRALENLLNQTAEDTSRLRGLFYHYVDLAYRLEVHFLFPNLDDAERNLLAGLGSARSAILLGSRNSEYQADSEARTKHDAALLSVKQKFLTLRAEVMSRGTASRLTALQQQLLEREFLALPKREGIYGPQLAASHDGVAA